MAWSFTSQGPAGPISTARLFRQAKKTLSSLIARAAVGEGGASIAVGVIVAVEVLVGRGVFLGAAVAVCRTRPGVFTGAPLQAARAATLAVIIRSHAFTLWDGFLSMDVSAGA